MEGNRQYSKEAIENMLCLWRSGLNYPQIAAKTGKSKGAVKSLVRRYMTDEDKIRAADLLSNPTRISASRVDGVMKSWREGWTYAEIAKAHGFNMSQTKAIISKNRTEKERGTKRAQIRYSIFHQKSGAVKKCPTSLDPLPTETAPRPSQSFVGIHFRKCQWIAGKPSADESCKCGEKTGPDRVYCPSHKEKAKRVNYNDQ